ncbi:zinc metalloprotease HtpX [Hippea maritima]|uniref:Protease HtpX homolog n=1 Tax=Hippea maritima (strain ATCC 700847 / DSM 10411 / MH2) TaxID=760142 RepID=F2LY48_HIPMA|nr:zinc metalloprotease HtpX [Hippea maritima]AEA34371.1 protease htpX [Hippea maritima DSM 10411]
MNTVKTVFLLTLLAGIFMFIGGLLGGKTGLIIAFILSILMNFFSYFFSDKIALTMYRAKPVSEQEAPELYAIVRKLCERANLPMPKLYIIPQAAPNAFATGRNPNHAAVAVTQGAIELLTREELMGVLGHELGHIKHRDILISTITATIASAIMMIADMIRWAAIFGGLSGDDEDHPIVLLIVALIAPFAAVLIQLAISRAREYEADKAGAVYSGNPLYLASALEKLENYARTMPFKGNPATENLFIVNPFSAKGIMNLLSTHPPIEERIRRLREMAAAGV